MVTEQNCVIALSEEWWRKTMLSHADDMARLGYSQKQAAEAMLCVVAGALTTFDGVPETCARLTVMSQVMFQEYEARARALLDADVSQKVH